MPRKERKHSETGIYHLMLRGINRQDIFDEDADYWALIRTLSSIQYRLNDDLVTKVCTCHIYAYCLMPNHIHLLLSEKDWKVGDVIKSIASSYVLYYNKKYGRTGHLFQDRFKSEPCNDSSYFITLFRYIHQNPIKAGLSKTAKEYRYSSWGNDYLGSSVLNVCYVDSAINRYGMGVLTDWVDSPLTDEVRCLDMDERVIISDERIRQMILEKSGATTIAEFQSYGKEVKYDIIRYIMQEIRIGPRQMSRVSGLTYSVIYKLAKQ